MGTNGLLSFCVVSFKASHKTLVYSKLHFTAMNLPPTPAYYCKQLPLNHLQLPPASVSGRTCLSSRSDRLRVAVWLQPTEGKRQKQRLRRGATLESVHPEVVGGFLYRRLPSLLSRGFPNPQVVRQMDAPAQTYQQHRDDSA
jgi:hypothetical protein